MADESQYSAGADTTAVSTNKRKYDDQTSPPRTRTTGFSSPPRARTTGFSSPIASRSPPLPTAYNSVPPPIDGIQAAKQKAQEIAARLLSAGAGADMKRPRTENGSNTGFDSYESKGYSSSPADGKSMMSNSASTIPVSYGGGYNGGGGGGYSSGGGGGGYSSGGGGGNPPYAIFKRFRKLCFR